MLGLGQHAVGEPGLKSGCASEVTSTTWSRFAATTCSIGCSPAARREKAFRRGWTSSTTASVPLDFEPTRSPTTTALPSAFLRPMRRPRTVAVKSVPSSANSTQPPKSTRATSAQRAAGISPSLPARSRAA